MRHVDASTEQLWAVDGPAARSILDRFSQARPQPGTEGIKARPDYTTVSLGGPGGPEGLLFSDPGGRPVAGSVAVVPVAGELLPRKNFLSDWLGLSTSEGLAETVTELSKAGVAGIVLDVDSPGGAASLVPEAAAAVRAASERVPVVAVANPFMASAAYWIGSAAGRVAVTPSGQAGSVGVIAVYVEASGAMRQRGYTAEIFRAGEFKAEANGLEPLTEAAKEYWRDRVESLHSEFVAAVAEYRGTTTDNVRANFGRGRMMSARDALDAGAVDEIATMGEVLAGMLGGTGGGAAGRSLKATARRIDLIRNGLAPAPGEW